MKMRGCVCPLPLPFPRNGGREKECEESKSTLPILLFPPPPAGGGPGRGGNRAHKTKLYLHSRGVIPFSLAYAAADSLYIGRTMSSLG